jgi:hypothetical protein
VVSPEAVKNFGDIPIMAHFGPFVPLVLDSIEPGAEGGGFGVEGRGWMRLKVSLVRFKGVIFRRFAGNLKCAKKRFL